MASTAKQPQVEYSVVIPVYNERENLPLLLPRLVNTLDQTGQAYEIIFVDDGSQDGSPEQLEDFSRRDSRIRVSHFERNTGQSAAFYAGFQAARGKWIITLDSDLQNQPEDIPRLLALKDQVDMVCGIRRKRYDGRLKFLSSRLAYYARQLLLHDGIRDTGCSLKVFRRDIIPSLVCFKGLHRFLPALAQIAGFSRMVQVDVSHASRPFGKTKYHVWDRLWVGLFDLFGVFWLKHRFVRLSLPPQGEEINV